MVAHRAHNLIAPSIAATYNASYAVGTPPAAGLVLGFGFNEGVGTTVADVSGNSNTGAISGATRSTAGKFGNALSFNGSNSWITVNSSTSLNLTTGMTLEAWVNPSAATGWRTVMLKEQGGNLIYALYSNTDTNRPSGHVFIAGDSETRGTVAVPVNTWTHLAVTFNGSMLRLFVNGAEVSSKAVSGSIQVSTGALRIGGNAVWPEYFSGLIDEVRIYNRALSAAEIQTDMNTPVQ